MTDAFEPSISPTPQPEAEAKEEGGLLLLHPRREPFEHGLLPISKLIFSDGTASIAPLRHQLLRASSSPPPRIDALAISQTLQISLDHARLFLDTLAAVLPSDSDPLAGAKPHQIDSVGADINDLILFLYIQSYKRPLPTPHKDSAAVDDVWPVTSAFDSYFSALSALQFVRGNGRRFMSSQVGEEAHQLSYLQRHLANIVALLAEPADGQDEGLLVMTLERFEHLGFLIQFGETESEIVQLGQAAPFFANSDPDMPAVAVPAAHVHEWLLQKVAASVEHIAKKGSTKESSPSNALDPDATMADADTNSLTEQNSSPLSGTNATYCRGQTFVEGFSKASVKKQATDIKGCSVKILNCHDSVIYILAPLRYATVYGCSDTTIVLGAIGKGPTIGAPNSIRRVQVMLKSVRVEHCERVHVITATKRICIANCRECVYFLGVKQRPLLLGDNHKLQVAPYNTFYSELEEHMNHVGIDTTVNRWDEPLVLGVVHPHDSLSHPAGVSDVPAESATCLDPDKFIHFLIPISFGGKSTQPTKCNPFPLPEIYMSSQRKNHLALNDIKQALRDVQLEENQKRELAWALHVQFKDWLYASGNIRQLYHLQGD